jgi:hypothetical protein
MSFSFNITFSFTGVAYLIGAFVIGLLAYRFFQYWRRERTTVAKGFLWFAIIFSFFMLVTAIAGLFFADNTQVLRATVIGAAFLQSLGFATIAYLVFYLKFPQISPWFGFFPILLLGLIATALTAIIPFSPYLEPSGGINWDIQPLADIFRFFLFVITFLPFGFLIIQQAKQSKDPIVKARSIGIGLALGFGVIVGLLDFFLETILQLGAVSSDIAMSVLSFVVLLVILFTQKPPQSGYVTRVND